MLKKILYLFIFYTFTIFISCNQNSEEMIPPNIVKNPKSANKSSSKEIKYSIMEFKTILEDFGKISSGEKVIKEFEFTNTGEGNLVITNAKGSCGCTVPSWPRKVISPGESGKITVVFNSEGKKGRQHKKIYITANTNPATNIIAITGMVVAPKN